MKNKNSSILMRVKGHSMKPLLVEGDVVRIKKIKKPKTGDIVLFFGLDKKMILHRYVKLGNKILTMGDLNTSIDWYKPKKFIGVADINESRFRKIYFSLRIIFIFLFNFNKEKNKRERKGERHE